ncbi:hypothetical protein Tco_0631033 [Tanacetum coccineum]
MAVGNNNKKSVDDGAFEAIALGNQTSLDADLQPMALGNQTSLDADLQIAPDMNEPIPSPIEDANLIALHPNTFLNPTLLNWNWDDVIVIPSDDDEANVNEPIPLPVEDANVEIAPHHNLFFNPKLLNWNWDDVIIVQVMMMKLM